MSFRKGQNVRLVLGEHFPQFPLGLQGEVLFSGNPYGKGHRTLVLSITGEKRWVSTQHLEPNV